MQFFFASIPSPSTSEIHLGPFPLRGYALCIIVGIFVAVWLGNRRLVTQGGRPGAVADIAVWAVPFGLVGGRLYHVLTDYQLYFGTGRNPLDALKIWEGGLGIWGAIALGAVGAWIGCRRTGVALPAFAGAIAPGLALAQAIGRWGNWFNQELYGGPTQLPWALEISNSTDQGLFHPVFLYESLWCAAIAVVLIVAERRFSLNGGAVFVLYVGLYCAGRLWIEALRIDEVNHLLGLRLNTWTAAFGLIAAAIVLAVIHRRRAQAAIKATTATTTG